MAAMQIAYHIETGATEMYDIDARSAVANFPKEWSFDPWPAGGKPAAGVVEKPDVVIPDNWKELTGPERIALARQVGKKGNFGAEKADIAIQEYIDAHPAAPDEET